MDGLVDHRLLPNRSFCRPFSNLNPAVVRCNSDKAFLDDCLVRAVRFFRSYLGLKPQAEYYYPFGISPTPPGFSDYARDARY
jgi:hypothetical protein